MIVHVIYQAKRIKNTKSKEEEKSHEINVLKKRDKEINKVLVGRGWGGNNVINP